MSHIPEKLLKSLVAFAAEVCEEASFQAHTVDQGVGANELFGHSGTVVSGMRRSITAHAVLRAASVVALGARQVGDLVEIVTSDEAAVRTFRLKTAERCADGSYKVLASQQSTLLTPPAGETLLWEEQWILGCSWADDHTIKDLFVAEVLGAEESTGSGPVRLHLGPVTTLSSLTTPPLPPRFESDEDDMLGGGFDDDQDGEANDEGQSPAA